MSLKSSSLFWLLLNISMFHVCLDKLLCFSWIKPIYIYTFLTDFFVLILESPNIVAHLVSVFKCLIIQTNRNTSTFLHVLPAKETWEMLGMCWGKRGCSLDDVLRESDDPLVLPRAPLAPRQWPVLMGIRGPRPKPDPALLLVKNGGKPLKTGWLAFIWRSGKAKRFTLK